MTKPPHTHATATKAWGPRRDSLIALPLTCICHSKSSSPWLSVHREGAFIQIQTFVLEPMWCASLAADQPHDLHGCASTVAEREVPNNLEHHSSFLLERNFIDYSVMSILYPDEWMLYGVGPVSEILSVSVNSHDSAVDVFLRSTRTRIVFDLRRCGWDVIPIIWACDLEERCVKFAQECCTC